MNAIVYDGVMRCHPQISTYTSVMPQLEKAYCYGAKGDLQFDDGFVPSAEWMSAARELYIAIRENVWSVAMDDQEFGDFAIEATMWTCASEDERDQKIKQIMVSLAPPNIAVPRFREMEKKWITQAVHGVRSSASLSLSWARGR